MKNKHYMHLKKLFKDFDKTIKPCNRTIYFDMIIRPVNPFALKKKTFSAEHNYYERLYSWRLIVIPRECLQKAFTVFISNKNLCHFWVATGCNGECNISALWTAARGVCVTNPR